MKKGKLFLIPVPLGQTSVEGVLPGPVQACARQLKYFVAENAKSARAFLKSLPCDTPLQQIEIQELNEHTTAKAIPGLLSPLLAGQDVGLISEAGCPAVADPGAKLVALAHKEGICVFPMIGPSSILLALMGSGLSGQNFAFHGYLPAKDVERQKKIRELEAESKRFERTQIFIETPYRNMQMFQTLIQVCGTETRICVATDLTLESQFIMARTVFEWKQSDMPEINRRPTVFLIQC